MADKGPFYITTAISYTNGDPHLGHAYEAILTDVMARFKRLDGYNVYFLTGTDEHGEKVMRTAEKEGVKPIDIADKYSSGFEGMTKTLNISNDQFIRTSEPRHYAAAQALWSKLESNGDIYLGEYEGWYSTRDEAFYTDDEVSEKDGVHYGPQGTEVERRKEESYFFKLSAYADQLLNLYNKGFVLPESRQNEITSFVKNGLRDLSVSRHKDRLHWGIPVPGNEDHVMYVWLDALTNYMTGVGYPDVECDNFKTYWPADVHVIGKDITRFHAIYWPAFLMAADIPLPKHIFAHGFINVQGEKMSKSVGNVLSPEGLVKTYGQDQIRYFLAREIPHGQDGNFGHEQAVLRINSDLANGIGNLAQRTLSMIYKNCDAAIPEGKDLTSDDNEILSQGRGLISDELLSEAEQFKFHRALEIIGGYAAACDRYVDEQAPWVLKKENPERMKTVLYVLAEALRCLGVAMQPYTPEAAGKLLDQLKVPEDQRMFEHLSSEFALQPGTVIDKPEGLFPRIVEEEAA